MINRISKYRREIMGVAIVMIMLCHTTLFFEPVAIRKTYYQITNFLKIGVDIFFLLSGLGLYYSFKRDCDLAHFYKKRIYRILPTYIGAIICWGLVAIPLSLENASRFLEKYSLITFFTAGETSAWFVAAILSLYAIFPVIYKGIMKADHRIYIYSAILYAVSFSISLLMEDGSGLRRTNEAFFVRIPTFLVGIVLGKRIYEARKIDHAGCKALLLGCASFALLVINARYNMICMRWVERVLFLPISYCLTYGVAFILERNMILHKPLRVLGGITLEIYLIHEKVLLVYDTYMIRCMVGSFVSNISAIVIAVLVAYMYSKVVAHLFIRQKMLG